MKRTSGMYSRFCRLEHLGKPKKIILVEFGPGDGSLCYDLLNTFKKFKDFYNNHKKYMRIISKEEFEKKFM